MVRQPYFERRDCEAIIVSSPGAELNRVGRNGAQTIAVPIAREISVWRDLLSFWRIFRVIQRLRPSITNVGTPKAVLLGGIAAWMLRVPCRYYTLHGLRCETFTGLKRLLLLLAERVACSCAHRVICVSNSLREKAIELGIVNADRIVVLAQGSCAGVDAEKFAPTAESIRRAHDARTTMGIPSEAPVVGFVGRLTQIREFENSSKPIWQFAKRFPG